MVNFSWRQWLRAKNLLQFRLRPRQRPVPQTLHIEGLESRTMLTAPVAVDDSGYVVNEDGTLDTQNASVLDNDTDADSDPITTASLGTDVAHGTLHLNSNGTFTYTPDANFHGTDFFTYFATDDQNETSATPATVTITVNQVNDAGTFGGNTSGSGAEDSDITGTLTFADTIDGFTTPDFSVSVVATHGVASIDPTSGEWTYSPNANYHGTDSFTVSVTDDDGNVESQVISLTITQVNDPGTFGGDTSGSGAEDTDITGTLTFADTIDGFTTPDFSVSVVAAHGVASIDSTSGEWTYSPNANYHGADSFTVSVTDDDGNVESQVISLTITQVNDPGTFGGDTSGSGQEDTDITGTLTFADTIDVSTTPDFAITVDPTHGTASIDPSTGAWIYTPGANFHGTDSFSVTVHDDDGNAEIQVINLTVGQINDPGSFAGDISGSGVEHNDIYGTLTFTDAIDGFTTPDFAITVNPTHGTANIDSMTGEWTYSPNANYHGADSFTVSVTDDDGNVETQVVSLTITQVNDLGTFGGDTSGSGQEDVDIAGTVTFTDAIDGFTTPNFTVSVAAAHGVASIDPTTGDWTYSPNANFHGADSFTVCVTDDDGNVEAQVISLTITQVNDPGVFAGAIAGSGNEDTNIIGTLTFSDSSDGATTPNFTVSVVAVNGVASIDSSTGTWTYSPNANFHGADSFTVSVTDDDGNVETQVIALTVVAVADLIAIDDNFTVATNDVLTGNVSTNDSTTSGGTLTFTLGTNASHGVLNLNSDGSFTYTPETDFFGTDTFTYMVTDAAAGESATRTVTIAVGDLLAQDDSFTTNEDTLLTGNVALNDSTSSGGTLTYAVDTNAIHGTLNLNSDGAFTYTPNTNFNGADSFTYIVTDSVTGHTATQTVSLTITAVADLVSNSDSFTVNEDTLLTGTVASNDSTTSGGTLTYTVNTNVAHGVLSLNTDGSFTYTPNANFHGSDSFTFLVTDAAAAETSTQTVIITVTAVADLSAEDDTFNVNEDTPLSGNVSTNDSTTSSGTLAYTLGADVSHGVLALNADGSFTYTPDANFHGTDSFTYLVTDAAANESSTQTVTITIASVTDLVAADDTFHVSTNTVLTGDVSLNDTTTSGGTLSFAVATDVSHGVLNLSANGTFIYTPDTDYHGDDTFTYTVTDGSSGESSTKTVTISVGDLMANDDTFNIDEDTQLNGDVSLNDTTTSGGTLTYATGTDVSHGTLIFNSDGSFNYTPSANFNGTDSFTYVVTDATAGETSTRTVTITVVAVADLVAGDDVVSTAEDTPLTSTLSGNDSTTSGGTLTYAVNTNVSHGVLNLNSDGSFTYSPGANFHGADSFTYTVTDATASETLVRTVTITVTAVNDAPIANSANVSTNEDVVLSGNLTGSDVDNDTLTYAIGATSPSHGVVVINPDGSFTYTPTANYHGSDTFTFTVNDGSATSTEATVTISVVAVNDIPVADPLSFTTVEDTAYDGTLTASDADNDTLVFAAGSVSPSHGAVTVNADGTFTYTPAANYVGADSFSFKVNDGTANSSEVTVTVNVTSVNDAPTVTNGSGTVTEDAFLVSSVSPLGFDVEGDSLTYSIATMPTHGTLTLSPDGTFTYIPNANYFGTDSFTFKASDGQAFSGIATYTITVVSVDDALLLSLPNGAIQVGKNNSAVQLDTEASVDDVDTNINYMNSQIRVAILAGGSAADSKNGRVTLLVKNQGNGPGQIRVKGHKIYFDGSRTPVATFTGGKKGQPLLITFTGAASHAAVNAVLKQLSVQASRKASTGARTVGIQVTADGQSSSGTKIATIS